MSTPITYVSYRSIVGKVVASHRQRLGIQQGALAAELGMTQANLSRLETGEAILNVEQLGTIAAKLGMSSAMILAEADRAATSLRAQGYNVVTVKADAPDNWTPLAKVALAGLIVAALLNS